MRARLLFIVLAGVVVAGLAALNWGEVTRTSRLNFGLMQVEIAVNDPKAYTKPWSVTIEMAVQVDTQMLEEICLDNEKDTKLYK